jgi:hypothetical protein
MNGWMNVTKMMRNEVRYVRDATMNVKLRYKRISKLRNAKLRNERR